MIPFEQALETVLKAAPFQTPLPDDVCEVVPLVEGSGRILQQTVAADRDMPPFDKSAVDGYACKRADLEQGIPMRLLEVIPAGTAPRYSVTQGCCSKVMTGAMVPQGTECVAMVEEAWEEGNTVCCAVRQGGKTNICLKGEDLSVGAPILHPGCVIQPQHIAMLSAVGCTEIRVAQKVEVGILSTGDELTEPWESPSNVQIRNSNAFQLMAQALRMGAKATYYGIAKDHVDSFTPLLAAALKERKVVIVSGGVSMGDFDIVPQVAQRLGLHILFDRVAVQPGKPTTFGVGTDSFFFGLPGNPVSSFVQFELMVKPFLMRMMGAKYAPLSLRLPLAHPFKRKQADRMAHLPMEIDESGRCRLLHYHGSGHIGALSRAQGVARINLGVSELSENEIIESILC